MNKLARCLLLLAAAAALTGALAQEGGAKVDCKGEKRVATPA